MICGLGRAVVTVEVHYGAWWKISAWELPDVEAVVGRDMPRPQQTRENHVDLGN